MAVSPDYRDWVLEQMGRVRAVTSRAMFGGVGLYSDGLFFGLLDDNSVYLKGGDNNRARFQAAGCRQFQPAGMGAMDYWEIPAGALDDVDQLESWMELALTAARAARARRPGARRKR